MPETIFEKKDDTLNVRPAGRLDTATSPVFEKELRQHLDGVQHIVMDFTDVEYVSSAGLRTLLTAERLMEDRDGGVRLTHVNANILEVFEMVGFMEIVTVERD